MQSTLPPRSLPRITLRFALLVICALTAGATAGLAWHSAHHVSPAHPVLTSPTVTTPPGWTSSPVGTNVSTEMCFGLSCYHVDSQGHPYGPVITTGR